MEVTPEQLLYLKFLSNPLAALGIGGLGAQVRFLLTFKIRQTIQHICLEFVNNFHTGLKEQNFTTTI